MRGNSHDNAGTWIVAGLGGALGAFTFLTFTHNALLAADWCDGSAACLREWIAALSGWAAAALAGGTVAVLVATLKEMRRGSEIQAQAYVHASKAAFGTSSILISCKNTGLTPAIHFAVNGEARIVERGTVSSSISFKNDGFKIWSALAANDELSVVVDVDPTILTRFRSNQCGRDDMLLVTGQIIYCTVDNHDHLTQFVFYVDGNDKRHFRRPTTANVKAFWRIAAGDSPMSLNGKLPGGAPRPQMPRIDETEETGALPDA